MLPPIADIVENFELIEDWEQRYGYIIELGREMDALPEALHTEENRVHGCESQVWLDVGLDKAAPEPRLALRGDSDSSIVRGFVALMVALYQGKTPQDAAETDGLDIFRQLDFGSHVTSKRSNGVRAMVARIQHDARRLAAA
ncbi:SufE family protein [Methylobacterium gnaphalii]|nr:SufE family protein [Methylobacterium gnaphalii]GJD68015.1 Cysteine desulfuration protein SufE [Methylobacterium gnaphalii]